MTLGVLTFVRRKREKSLCTDVDGELLRHSTTAYLISLAMAPEVCMEPATRPRCAQTRELEHVS